MNFGEGILVNERSLISFNKTFLKLNFNINFSINLLKDSIEDLY